MAKELQNSTDFPAASGTYAYRAALMVAGASQAAAAIVAAPITPEEELTVYNLPAGNTVLTIGIMRYDMIVSDNPTATSLEVPQNATLGLTYATGKAFEFFVQRRGLGVFSVNYSGTAAKISANDVDITTLAQYHSPVRISSHSADAWCED